MQPLAKIATFRKLSITSQFGHLVPWCRFALRRVVRKRTLYDHGY